MDINTLLGIAGLGAAGVGAVLGSRAQGRANDLSERNADRLFGLADQERERRDQLQSILLPQILKGMRVPRGTEGIGGPSIGGPRQAAPQAAPYAAPYAAPGARGGIGGAAKGALGGAMAGSKIGALGGPLGMGIGAGVGALASQMGKLGANEARDWVKGVQNPFGTRVGGIIDPIDRARAGGTLTPEMLEAAKAALESEITGYNTAASQYRGLGGKQNRVIDQSYQTLNPMFDAWRRSLVM